MAKKKVKGAEIDKLMTQKELFAEVNKFLVGYRQHCMIQGLDEKTTEDRMKELEGKMRICVNDFSSCAANGEIAATLLDWQAFFNGFLSGAAVGQQMTADALGVGEVVREAHGK